ncbi:type I polyketide synthase [Skermanella aerolata]|nr:type I polyketide synthase [Skermanella aerolata]
MAENHDETIAIVGIGCRLPGGVTCPDSFWTMLVEGRDGIVEVPEDRWNIDTFFDRRKSAPGKMYVRAGGFLQQKIDEFDAQFFGMSPREAAYLDPQQRLLLEVTWEALEDARLIPAAMAGSDTGVYIGGFMLDNMLTQFGTLNRDQIGSHSAVSSTLSILSNRLSYVFDFRGPSITMDTACSSSLVAVHQACRALARGECGIALAGGVNVMYRPETVIAMCKGGFLAPDGRSKSFDARADGYGRGEGAGVVVLKKAADAIRDGDEIYALIRGTGVNQDGRTDGITVPNPASQEALIRQVCVEAAIDPRDIRYVEAHGTGTAVGDPLEAAALGAVLGQGRGPGDRCVVGSVKANIGHLEAAAGIAGLIKAALCLKHGAIPPVANLETPNPDIPFDELGLKLAVALEPMPAGKGPALAAVNSFGYGGTNAHALLQEAPCRQAGDAVAPEKRPGPYVLPISARGDGALKAMAKAYAEQLDILSGDALADLCRSAAVHRSHHDSRLVVFGRSSEELAATLRLHRSTGQAPGAIAGNNSARGMKPVFVFTGMGPQWWGMGRDLLAGEAEFREFAEDCDRIFKELAGWSILAEMTRDEADSRILETQIAQPANFVVQAGLAHLWRSRGVEPAAILGHSVGEVTAAYVAGVLSLEDAIRVAYHRSRVQKQAAGLGTMLAVGLGEADATALLRSRGGVSIAAINSPSSLTLSGDAAELQAISLDLTASGVFNRFLQVEVAYHSAYMDPLRAELMASLAGLAPATAAVRLYSTVTGRQTVEGEFDARYWFRNVREPVYFAGAMDAAIADGHCVFLEIGPHPVLSASIKQCLDHRGVQGHVLASLRRGHPELDTMAEALAGLHACGSPVDWRRFYPQAGAFVRLPAYPWQRESHWQETDGALADRLERLDHALLGRRAAAPNPSWQGRINRNLLPYVDDHRVESSIVLPGAAYVELGFAVHRDLGGAGPHLIEHLEFSKAMVIDPADEPLIHVTYDQERREYEVHGRSREAAPWTVHARGRLSFLPFDRPAAADLAGIRARCGCQVTAAAHYAEMQGRGLHYGPWFNGVRQLWRAADGGEVLAFIQGHEALGLKDHRNLLHPTLLDACFQALLAAIRITDDPSVYVPVRIREARLHTSPDSGFWCHGKLLRHDGGALEGDIRLLDDDGRILAEFRGIEAQALSRGISDDEREMDKHLYRFVWHEEARPEAPAASRPAPGRFVLLMDKGGVGERLAADLTAAGADPVIGPDDKAALQRMLADGPVGSIVHLRSLDGPADPAGLSNTLTALDLIQAVTELGLKAPVFFVTRQAQPAGISGAEVAVSQAPLAGLVRVAVNEFAEHRFRMIDIDGGTDAESALVHEILGGDENDDVALRGARRLVSRFEHTTAAQLESGLAPGGSPGGSKELRRYDPGPGEVEVAIRQAVMLAPGSAAAIGVVTRRGAGVGIGTGQEAILPIDGPITPFAVISERCLQPVPKRDTGPSRPLGGISGSLSEALRAINRFKRSRHGGDMLIDAGIGSAPASGLVLAPLAAAHHALLRVARLTKGESILVAGSGPLSLAAVQVARSAGAAVTVAAKGAGERPDLAGLGIEPVLDCGSPAFVADIRERTRGGGFDVVFNTLEGETAGRLQEVLTSSGRFIDASRSKSRALHPAHNQSLARIDVAKLMSDVPAAFGGLLQRVADRIDSGHLIPPPLQAADGAPAVVDFSEAHLDPSARTALPPVRFDPERTYLVTGGFGGLGLELSRWLVGRGVRHLVLVGRRGADAPGADQAIRSLEALGARVHAAAADIADKAQVEGLLRQIAGIMPPLTGIFHTAAVLDDGPIYTIRPSQFATVMRAKALGAWNLHLATQGLELTCFVMFSSIASVLGSPGQATYVAANAFQDALAHHRRGQGMAAISVNLGAVSEVGMAARHEGVEQYLARVGVGSFTPERVLNTLGRILSWNPVQIGAADVDWRLWGGAYPAWAASPRYRHLMPAAGVAEETDGGQRGALCRLDPAGRHARIREILAELLSEILRLPPERIDPGLSLLNMGIDSLMAMETQVAIDKRIGIKISVLELMKGNSMDDLAGQMADMLAGETSAGPDAAPAAPVRSDEPDDAERFTQSAAGLLARIDHLSDDEIEEEIRKLSSEEKVQA